MLCHHRTVTRIVGYGVLADVYGLIHGVISADKGRGSAVGKETGYGLWEPR
jgi:hypothetical protein